VLQQENNKTVFIEKKKREKRIKEGPRREEARRHRQDQKAEGGMPRRYAIQGSPTPPPPAGTKMFPGKTGEGKRGAGEQIKKKKAATKSWEGKLITNNVYRGG